MGAARADPVNVTVGEVTLKTARSICPPEIWRAGEFYRFQPVSVKRQGEVVRIDFEPSPVGELVAEWRLAPGHRAAKVKLSFTPAADGSYSLGYHLFCRRSIDEVEELQLPLAFPAEAVPGEGLHGA